MTASFSDVSSNNELIIKVMVLGDSGTGKSQLFGRMLRKPFNPISKPTAGIDFGTLSVKIASGKMIKAQIVDTSGLERFRSVIQSYWGLATGAMIVYDVTSQESFTNVRKWVRDFKAKHVDKTPQPAIMIVGNRSDRPKSERQVPTHEAQAYCLAQNFLFMETSAYENHQIDLAFNILLTDIFYLLDSSRPKAPALTTPPPPVIVHGQEVQPRTSSLPPGSPTEHLFPTWSSDRDNTSQHRHKSFDERLFEQAKSFFGGWIGKSEPSTPTSPTATLEGEFEAKLAKAATHSESAFRGIPSGPAPTMSAFASSVASAVRGRFGSMGFDEGMLPAAAEPLGRARSVTTNQVTEKAAGRLVGRSRTVVERPTALRTNN